MNTPLQYYVLDGDHQLGPYTEIELRNRAVSGAMPYDALIWREGFHEWTSFADCFPLPPYDTIPPIPRHHAFQPPALPQKSKGILPAIWIKWAVALFTIVNLFLFIGRCDPEYVSTSKVEKKTGDRGSRHSKESFSGEFQQTTSTLLENGSSAEVLITWDFRSDKTVRTTALATANSSNSPSPISVNLDLKGTYFIQGRRVIANLGGRNLTFVFDETGDLIDSDGHPMNRIR
ncbi:MAG: DUF4339 domain-containing protein [Akkermansiaceae bacterium]|nr:DUF4339 domain-containing protein [Akkermansiaceae bacterium]